MVEVEYAHLCDFAFPGENGKPCVIGIFDVINVVDFPAVYDRFQIAVQLRGAPHEEVNGRIEVGRPNGEVLATVPVPPMTMSTEGGAFLQVAVVNLGFPEQGRYVVKVISGARTLVSKSLQLRRHQHGQAPPVAH